MARVRQYYERLLTGSVLAAMLTKFETKSNRVKGLSFHPKRCFSRTAAGSSLAVPAGHKAHMCWSIQWTDVPNKKPNFPACKSLGTQVEQGAQDDCIRQSGASGEKCVYPAGHGSLHPCTVV